MAIDINNLSLGQLKRAVAIKEQIETLQTELAGLLGTPQPAAAAAAAVPGKRTLSAATRAKMAAAHQARWAKLRAAQGAPKAASAAPQAPAKRRLSPAGRAAIIAGTKARWAKLKTGQAAVTSPAKPIGQVVVKPKRKISAEARRRMVEGGKARWAKVKAAGKGNL